MTRLTSILLLLVALVTAVSCGPKVKEEKLAPELAQEARVQFEKERYAEAIAIYTKLRDWYPFDKLAVEAELNIAEAHFKMEEYDEAAIAYEEFEKLHPRHEKIAYVLNQQALCFFNRLDTPDRDQTNALKAVALFNRLIRQYPESEYTPEAEKNIQTCLKSLAAHEMVVGRYYLKSKKYESALGRFETVISSYDNSGFEEEAMALAESARQKMAEEEKPKSEEKSFFQRLWPW